MFLSCILLATTSYRKSDIKTVHFYTLRYCVSPGHRRHRHHRNGEDDRDHLIEDDTSSMRTEHIMMSGLSQTSFISASMFFKELCIAWLLSTQRVWLKATVAS